MSSDHTADQPTPAGSATAARFFVTAGMRNGYPWFTLRDRKFDNWVYASDDGQEVQQMCAELEAQHIAAASEPAGGEGSA